MSLQHADFAENFELLGKMTLVGVTTEQNLATPIDLADYTRVAIPIHALAVGTSLDVDIEVLTAVGGTPHTLKSIEQLDGNADGGVVVIDIRPDELSNPSGAASNEYRYLNVEVTPSGSATVSVLIWGIPRNKPADNSTALAEHVS